MLLGNSPDSLQRCVHILKCVDKGGNYYPVNSWRLLTKNSLSQFKKNLEFARRTPEEVEKRSLPPTIDLKNSLTKFDLNLPITKTNEIFKGSFAFVK